MLNTEFIRDHDTQTTINKNSVVDRKNHDLTIVYPHYRHKGYDFYLVGVTFGDPDDEQPVVDWEIDKFVGVVINKQNSSGAVIFDRESKRWARFFNLETDPPIFVFQRIPLPLIKLDSGIQ